MLRHDRQTVWSSPHRRHAYSAIASGANHSRQTSITYPDGRVVHYHYDDSSLDDAISRLTSITNSATTCETYAYLGLGTVVKRVHIQGSPTEIGLTYIKQSGEGNGDAGDPYIGLDRFGRIVDQRWIKSTDVSNPMDRFQYGYDRDGNRL